MRRLALLGAVVIALVFISLATLSTTGQTPAPKSSAPSLPKPGPAPKMPWGEPDLQGTWFVMEAVPLERTAANANKPLLTDEEVAAADKDKAVNPGRNARSADSTQDVGGAYNAVFNSILKTSKRTSMIIDPPDGKIPPLTAEAQQRQGRGGRGGGAPGLGAGARG